MDPGRFTAASATRSTDLPELPEDTDPNCLFWPNFGYVGRYPALQIYNFLAAGGCHPKALLIAKHMAGKAEHNKR